MRIAVVGAGISGNLVARLLGLRHHVALYEAEPNTGGHTRTIEVEAFGRIHRVDTGFMVFNDRTYPNFCHLLGLLGIEGTPTDMSLSVRCESTGLEYQGSSLDGLFAQRRNLVRPAFLGMLADILRFHRDATRSLEQGLGAISTAEWLADKGYGRWFVDRYLVPMSAAIWSCRAGELLAFPAHFLLGFLRNHGLIQLRDRPQWMTIRGGARRYVEALLGPMRDAVVTGTRVTSVRRHADHVVLHTDDGISEAFDAVVLACHADQALALLPDADDTERSVLGSFPYQANSALVHTDVRLLPRRRRAWASWNYLVTDDPEAPVAVTYDLSRLQGLDSPSPILLTLNGDAQVDPAHVLDRYQFHHPVFTADSIRAQERQRELNGRRHTYFCGAYWGYGFHEDGVNSALAVARGFGLGWDSWKAASTTAACITSAWRP